MLFLSLISIALRRKVCLNYNRPRVFKIHCCERKTPTSHYPLLVQVLYDYRYYLCVEITNIDLLLLSGIFILYILINELFHATNGFVIFNNEFLVFQPKMGIKMKQAELSKTNDVNSVTKEKKNKKRKTDQSEEEGEKRIKLVDEGEISDTKHKKKKKERSSEASLELNKDAEAAENPEVKRKKKKKKSEKRPEELSSPTVVDTEGKRKKKKKSEDGSTKAKAKFSLSLATTTTPTPTLETSKKGS